MKDMEIQLQEIPEGTEYHANRYDDDNDMKLHVWDDNGNSYDIVASKLDVTLLGHYLGGKNLLEGHYDKLLDGLGEQIKKVIMNKIHTFDEHDFRIVILMIPKEQSPQGQAPLVDVKANPSGRGEPI